MIIRKEAMETQLNTVKFMTRLKCSKAALMLPFYDRGNCSPVFHIEPFDSSWVLPIRCIGIPVCGYYFKFQQFTDSMRQRHNIIETWVEKFREARRFMEEGLDIYIPIDGLEIQSRRYNLNNAPDLRAILNDGLTELELDYGTKIEEAEV